MPINQNIAAEQYQIASEILMDIAQNYEASDKAVDVALNAVNHLTLHYVDQCINNINQLNNQYVMFIKYMENVMADLENTLIDDVLVIPLQKSLNQAKKYIAEI